MRLLPVRLSNRLRSLAMEQGAPYRWAPDEFIPSMAIERFLADKHRVLVVGDATAREYELLTYLGKEVTVLDIVPLPNMPNFVQQSITDRTPFPDDSFDGVVMVEVLEHLFEDYVALNEIQRILKDDGILVLSVPYMSNRQDEAPYHVRVYTRRTVERLLAFCGFRIVEHFYRGLVSRLPQRALTARCLVLAPRVLLQAAFGSRGLAWYRRCCFRLEKWLGSNRLLSRLQRRFASYGGMMKVVKGERVDFAGTQMDAFSGKWAQRPGEAGSPSAVGGRS